MEQNCWHIRPDWGFLIYPEPLTTLQAIDGLSQSHIIEIEETANALPDLMERGTVRAVLAGLPLVDYAPLQSTDDFRTVERALQIYCYFVNAYLWAPDQPPTNRIPAVIAVPLVQLSRFAQRPPILSYAPYNLANWRKIDPNGAIEVDNLVQIQQFLHVPDAAWFSLIHVEIEAEAAPAITAIQTAAAATQQDDRAGVIAALEAIINSLMTMMRTFGRMKEGCDTDVYYQTIRAYMFGFDDVIYEGVAEFGETPVSFRGETGAQSTVIPALVAAMGLQHRENGLSEHLRIMRDYMPKPHRDFLAAIDRQLIRDYTAKHHVDSKLRGAYNTCLQAILRFRRLHLHMANEYIAKKVTDPRGTGGTLFMEWLGQLIAETEAQML